MKQLSYPFDSDLILRTRKSIKSELLSVKEARLRKKIAILGGSTTSEIKNILELFLLHYGIEPVFYESDFAQYWQDAMFGDKLREFSPDIVFIHTTSRNIIKWQNLRDNCEQVDALLEEQILHYTSMWDIIAQDLKCAIIQNNFERPLFRLLGNKDVSDFRGRTNFISRLNQAFYTYAQEHEEFYINDIDYLSASFGLERWSDSATWHMYQYALSINAIPELAFSVANIIKSLCGKNKKALVLDLDETLWGGVVGDDGMEGLVLGQETPNGRVYSEFQEYIKAHKDLGIPLNVCSKNDKANALAGLNHPDGVLVPEDFTIIKANWESKDRNVIEIAQELNIGADSLVFVDDNPAERAIVSAQIPGIAVPEVDTAEEYIKRIDRSGFFEVTTITSEDVARSEMYKENLKREKLKQQFECYSDYLKSLEMVAVIHDFEPICFARISQLANRSNQFNLTTKRYTESEIATVAEDSNYIKLYGKLSDKFGDNGLVSVIIGKKDGSSLHLKLWIMSCRVLKRDMEWAMLGCLVEKAQSAGIKTLVGYYFPTAKNGLVTDFYGTMGFDKVDEDEHGNTVWSYSVCSHVDKNEAIVINNE